MIAALAQDLLTRVASLAALTNRTGLAIGGRMNDPGLLKIPLPAAWIVLKTDTVDESSFQRGPASGLIPPSQEMMATFAITLFVPYIDDTDLLTTQFPLLVGDAVGVHECNLLPDVAPAVSARRVFGVDYFGYGFEQRELRVQQVRVVDVGND